MCAPMRKALLLFILVVLYGCGLKGPLELPPSEPNEPLPEDAHPSN